MDQAITIMNRIDVRMKMASFSTSKTQFKSNPLRKILLTCFENYQDEKFN